MNINRLLHAYVTDGKGEWHKEKLPDYLKDLPPEELRYLESVGALAVIKKSNPDYSTPDNFKKLLDKLFGDERMYEHFQAFVLTHYLRRCGECHFVIYLFSDWSRFCTLFAEFLALPETVEEFGWTPCDGFPECMQGERDICKYPDQRCEGNGKVRGQYSAWARMIQDEG